MPNGPTIVWIRQDLRLSDNPALFEAGQRGGAVIPVYIWSPDEEGDWAPGAAGRWWLHHSLSALQAELARLGSRLILRQGDSFAVLNELINATGSEAVYWNRRYEPAIVERDRHIKSILRESGLQAESFNASLLFEPWEVATKQKRPYQVFTPFWKSCLAKMSTADPLPVPEQLLPPSAWPASVSPADLKLLPRVDWDAGLRENWTPGEHAAQKQLSDFLQSTVTTYDTDRDRPDRTGTSRLSPHLHFGEISPRQILNAVRSRFGAGETDAAGKSTERFQAEIGWREFAHHVLFHFPETSHRPLRPQFENFPWEVDESGLRAWQRGQTGYPIVDAGMRELWHTGWMHNRVRMIVASFLTKDLRISWQQGARWFWDTLVDADLAGNTLGWQWAAGCGADAAPYFRIFNPVLQGEKFDPQGDYVRKWVPELSQIPDRWLHQPWQAPANVLAEARISLDDTYPAPIVDHQEARRLALEALSHSKTQTETPRGAVKDAASRG